MAEIRSVGPTGDQDVDGLFMGRAWASALLTYSFPGDAAVYGDAYGVSEPSSFAPLTDAQQTGVRAALALYSSVTQLVFAELTGTADVQSVLRFGTSCTGGSTAWGYYPSEYPEGGDVWFNRGGQYFKPVPGTYDFSTFLHEIGHALGLKHPHEAWGDFPAMTLAHDSLEYSIMSYRSYDGQGLDGGYTVQDGSYPQSLMMYDIAALQNLHGANYGTNSGDTIYRFDADTGELFINDAGQGIPRENRVLRTIWDGGGVDTYDLSNFSDDTAIDLAAGGWSITAWAQVADLGDGHLAVGTVANALLFKGSTASLIENATGGSGANRMSGNAVDNWLAGGAGDDTLLGLAGNDTLEGNAGDDRLDGGTGADRMLGGTGNDIYYVDSAGDRVIESRTAGVDTVHTSVSGLVLSAHVEALVLRGSALTGTGNSLANGLTGNGRDNVLAGQAGNDTLAGSTGDDRLPGGIGNDRLIGGSGADSLSGGDGRDYLSGGRGADVLSGGSGADSFLFAMALGRTEVDRITDFSVADDAILLDNAVFTALSRVGRLLSSAFAIGTAAGDASDRIIYNASTGALLYDADGRGGASATAFATLSTGLALTAADFLVT